MSEAPVDAGDPLLPGDPRWLGRHRLLGRLGAGGMGQVFLGRSPGGRLVAVKTVHEHLAAEPHFRERFRRETDAARAVTGPYTAAVVDCDPDGPLPWLATVYLPGVTLRRAVAVTGPLPPAAVLALAGALAEALRSIHAAGLVHRDLKPSNVLVTGDGPRVIDFGIARALDQRPGLTETGSAIGTPGYMAPEQIIEGRPVTGAADVFALGAVLAFAASGRTPFGDGNAAILLYRAVHEDPDLAQVPGTAGLRALIAGCLHKSPVRRPDPATLLRQAEDRTAPLWWREEPLRSLVFGVADAVPDPVPTAAEPDPAVLDPTRVLPPAVASEREPERRPDGRTEDAEDTQTRLARYRAEHRAARRRTLTRRGLVTAGAGGFMGLLGYSVTRPAPHDKPTRDLWRLSKGTTAAGKTRWTLSAEPGVGVFDGILATPSALIVHGADGLSGTKGRIDARAAMSGEARWSTDSFSTSPTAWGTAGDVLAAGDLGQDLIDLATGAERAKPDHDLSRPLWFTVAGSTLVTGYQADGPDSLVRGVAMRSGAQLWRRGGDHEWRRPAVVGSSLLLADRFGYLQCADADTGAVKWSYKGLEPDDDVVAVGALPPDRFAVLTGRDLHVVDVRDGSRVGRAALDVTVSAGSVDFARVGGTGLLISGPLLHGFGPNDAKVRWSRPALGPDACWPLLPGGDRAPVTAGGTLLHWADGRRLQGLDSASGKPRWEVRDLGDKDPAQCPPVVSGHAVLAATGRFCAALRRTDGTVLRRWTLPGQITGLAADTHGWYARIGRESVIAVNALADGPAATPSSSH